MKITIFVPTSKQDFRFLWSKIVGVKINDFNKRKKLVGKSSAKSFVEDRQFIFPETYWSLKQLNKIKNDGML